MSVEDGNKINKVFVDNQKQIDSLKLRLDSAELYHNRYMILNGQRVQKLYNDWNYELNNHKLTRAQADSFKMMYEANKRIYEFREHEFRKERFSQQVFTAAVMVLASILAFL
jgi:hypothetical protein